MNNSFLEFINKDIEGKKSLLQSLPTRTKTNKKAFNKEIEGMLAKYKEYEANIYKYITVKAKSINVKESTESLDKTKERVVALERVKFLLNPENTYIEKMGFDTLLYQINNYYTLNFKSLNAINNGFFDKFELAGIYLSGDDFDYTCYVHEYMNSYLEVRVSQNKDYKRVSEIFERIYWMNPEIIEHIELNFRRLIKKYSKQLNNYISKLQKEEKEKNDISSLKECNDKLQTAYIELAVSQQETVKDIIELSKNGVFEIEHYLESSKIRKQAYQSLIADSINLDDHDKMDNICNALEKIKGNINELNNYLEFLPLFNHFKTKYEKLIPTDDKQRKTTDLKAIDLEIAKKEKELEKLNRRIEGEGLFLNKIPANVKDLKVESVLKAKELYELYKKYDEAYFNEKVLSVLTSNMTISDVLNLYYSFDYFQKLAIQNVYKLTSYEEVVELSNKFDLFAMDPNNVIIAGLPLFHESNVAKIICNKYHLSSIYLEEDDLTIDNLKPLLNKVYIILRTHMIEKSEISLNQIWFITKVHKFMIEKESKEN